MELLRTAAGVIHLPLKETNSLVLRRGPYVIAAGLEGETQNTARSPAEVTLQSSVTGDLIDLFDANLAERNSVAVNAGTRAFLLDVNRFQGSAPHVLAASAKISEERASANALAFRAEGIDQTEAVARILSERSPRSVTVNHRLLDPSNYQHSGRTILLRFLNTAAPQEIRVAF